MDRLSEDSSVFNMLLPLLEEEEQEHEQESHSIATTNALMSDLLNHTVKHLHNKNNNNIASPYLKLLLALQTHLCRASSSASSASSASSTASTASASSASSSSSSSERCLLAHGTRLLRKTSESLRKMFVASGESQLEDCLRHLRVSFVAHLLPPFAAGTLLDCGGSGGGGSGVQTVVVVDFVVSPLFPSFSNSFSPLPPPLFSCQECVWLLFLPIWSINCCLPWWNL
jgi:hypothetical protein